MKLPRVYYVPGCITVAFLLSIPMCRWLSTPIPQTLTADYLKGTSVNFIFAADIGMTTLSESNDRNVQRLTLSKKTIFDGKGMQRTAIEAVPYNKRLLTQLSTSLQSAFPHSTRFDGDSVVVDLEAQNDSDMINLTSKMLELCLSELGITFGETFVLDYEGDQNVRRFKAFLDRNYPRNN